MVSCFISRLVILIFGTLYPAYASYKAVRTKNVKEYVKWMMYWIVFAFFTCAETFTDLFLSFWFPFYYEIKIITVIYLLSPATKGSSILYRKFVHPVLIKREQEIDEYIAKAKEQGYYTMLNLGSKGVTYATTLIMQTAIKGGGGLVSQLKKSYSLGDLTEEQHLRSQSRVSQDDVDSQYSDDPRGLRGMPGYTPRRPISSASQAGLYFPEVDPDQRRGGQNFYGHMPSAEDISSGYSSGDPLYYGVPHSDGSHLVRTASLGPTTRVRTRAATKNGLPKRASLSEGASTWSALEPRESQIETESFYNFSQPGTIPFPFASLNHLVRPEFQHLFGGLTQNQMFTFINHSQYPQPLNLGNNSGTGKTEAGENNPSVVISEVDPGTPNVSEASNTPETVASVEEKTEPKENQNENENKAEEKTTEEIVSVSKFSEDKVQNERSGKYNKKPAPVPPAEESKTDSKEDEEEAEFCTPNASPLPVRKHAEEKPVEIKAQDTNFLEVPKKGKTKGKKGDFNLSKKLHMPKMSFSFWNQKVGKASSGSESSLVSSSETEKTKTENPNDLEVFIPLKDTDDRGDTVNDELNSDQNQSVQN